MGPACAWFVDRRVTLAAMTTNTPGWSGSLPTPPDPGGSTMWMAPTGYPRLMDGSSPWASATLPAAAPSVVAEGPQAHPGWLTRGRVPAEARPKT
jgi:hypothetical protein